MYQSIELRKACCGMRKLEPLARMLAGRSAWVTGLRREQIGRTAATCRSASTTTTAAPSSTRWPTGRWDDVWHYVAAHDVPYNPLHDQFMPEHRLRALHARHRASARTSAPAAGGGKTKPPRNAACTCSTRRSPPHR